MDCGLLEDSKRGRHQLRPLQLSRDLRRSGNSRYPDKGGLAAVCKRRLENIGEETAHVEARWPDLNKNASAIHALLTWVRPA